MSMSVILLLLLGGALLIPILLDDEEDDPRDDAIKGTLGDDLNLQGTTGNDLILGFSGNDTINGNGGLDEIRGGSGMDTITGGADRDVINGGPDNDRIFGMGGNDTLEGGGGDDYIEVGDGSDIVRGGDGNDTIFGGTDDGSDVLRGEDGNDTIFMWGNEGRAFGGENNDEMIMVTGRGIFDGVSDNNTYYALANDDDTQQTLVIIDQFFLDQSLNAQDQIVMTIDTGNPALLDLPLQVTVTEGTINDGTSGYNIEVAFVDETIDPESYETARVFVLGTSVDIQTIVDAVKVDVTLNASLTKDGAEATFAQVKAGATAPASTVPSAVL